MISCKPSGGDLTKIDSSRYVTDMMNMLQGVYIFWAFVCNRKVLNIIFGRERVDRIERSTTKLYRQVVLVFLTFPYHMKIVSIRNSY